MVQSMLTVGTYVGSIRCVNPMKIFQAEPSHKSSFCSHTHLQNHVMATYTQPQSVACRLIFFQLICTDERQRLRWGKGKQAWPATNPPMVLFAATSRSSVLHQGNLVNCHYEVIGGRDSKEVPVGGSNWRGVDPARHELHQPALQNPKR